MARESSKLPLFKTMDLGANEASGTATVSSGGTAYSATDGNQGTEVIGDASRRRAARCVRVGTLEVKVGDIAVDLSHMEPVAMPRGPCCCTKAAKPAAEAVRNGPLGAVATRATGAVAPAFHIIIHPVPRRRLTDVTAERPPYTARDEGGAANGGKGRWSVGRSGGRSGRVDSISSCKITRAGIIIIIGSSICQSGGREIKRRSCPRP